MVSAALHVSPVTNINEAGVPDGPIDYSVPYRPREGGAERHFGFFPFFVKKPWQVMQEYIKHYTPPGALVCDPFIGSGVTAIESLVLGRRAVATDINPVARFITRMTAIAPIDLDGLQAAYEQVRDSVGQLIVSLDVMPEPEILALLHSLDYPRDSIPFKVRRSGAITIDQMHTPRQLAGLTLLRDAIVRVDDPVLRDLLKVAFANTVRYTNRTYIGRGQNEKGSPYRGNAGFLRRFSYSFATDRLFYEHKVWSTFELRYKAVCNTKEETNRLIGHRYTDSHFVLADVPASRIHEVTGEGMVDYCLTDPPYSDAIRFLDLSTLWAAWLDLPITEQDRRAELLIDTRPKKGNRAEFEREFAASVESIARALKEDRWFTLVYKHRDLSLWQVIVRICEDSGLHFVNSTWQDVGIPSTRQIENPGINPRGDMYLNFRKVSRQRFETLYGQTQVLALPTRANYIEHEAERIIVAYLGADIDLITSGVVQQVLNSRAFGEYQENPDSVNGDVRQVLNGSRFATWLSPNGGQPLKVMAPNQTFDQSLDATDRTRYALFELLREKDEVTEGEATQYLLAHLTAERNGEEVRADVPSLIRSLAQQVGPHRWRFDAKRVTEYKQLRLFFKLSGADALRERLEVSSRARGEGPLRPNMEGFALLRDRLREANGNNRDFDSQYGRLLEVLQTILLRLVNGYKDQIEQVLAIGEWAESGTDLRNSPYDDIVLDIVLRSQDRSFDFYWQLAEEVFTDVRDEDVVVQFQVSTISEWQQAVSLPPAEGRPEGSGIMLLGRA